MASSTAVGQAQSRDVLGPACSRMTAMRMSHIIMERTRGMMGAYQVCHFDIVQISGIVKRTR